MHLFRRRSEEVFTAWWCADILQVTLPPFEAFGSGAVRKCDVFDFPVAQRMQQFTDHFSLFQNRQIIDEETLVVKFLERAAKLGGVGCWWQFTHGRQGFAQDGGF